MNIIIISRYEFHVEFPLNSPYLKFVCFYYFSEWVCLLIRDYANIQIGSCDTRIKAVKYLQYYVNSVWN